jgi:hypothetical protein
MRIVARVVVMVVTIAITMLLAKNGYGTVVTIIGVALIAWGVR